MSGQVVGVEDPAAAHQEAADLARHGTGVEAVVSFGCDRLQRGGEPGIGELLPERVGAPIGLEVDGGGGRHGPQQLGEVGPEARQGAGYREAVAGVSDRRPQALGEWQAAETLVGAGPAVHRAGHGQRGAWSACVDHRTAVAVARGGRRGAPARIQDVLPAAGGVVDQPEGVAARAGHVRVDHAERRVDRHHRVDRAAPSLQHLQAGDRRQLVGRADRGRPGHERAAIPRIRGDPHAEAA